MPKVGVVLSGCGFLDGSEIHEATLTLHFLDKKGADVVCIAPDIKQSVVVDHQTNCTLNETRSVIIEASRIARGNVKNIKEINANDIDALVLPGGFGAAKNLSNFATAGDNCEVNPDLEKLILKLHELKKPIGFICIAPVIAAKALGRFSPTLTIGSDKQTADAITKLGAKHKNCNVDEIAVDEDNRIVSTPAYMLGSTISKVASGIEKLVNKVLEMAK